MTLFISITMFCGIERHRVGFLLVIAYIITFTSFMYVNASHQVLHEVHLLMYVGDIPFGITFGLVFS